MAETGKKVEVRFGAFSCSIEGYDNPVEQMREVLLLMQRMIHETPALADHDPGFGEAEVARIEDALDQRATRDGADSAGVVVIRGTRSVRNGDAEAEAEDAITTAEIPPGSRPDEETPGFGAGEAGPHDDAAGTPDPGDAGEREESEQDGTTPHATAGIFAAPVTEDEAAPRTDDGEDGDTERPLDVETGAAPAAAAIFSAPAAAVAEAAFSADLAGTAERQSDEQTGEQAGDPDTAEPAGADRNPPAEDAPAPDAEGRTGDAQPGHGARAEGANHLWDEAAAEPQVGPPDRRDDAVADSAPAEQPNHLWDAATGEPSGKANDRPQPGTPSDAPSGGDARADDDRAPDTDRDREGPADPWDADAGDRHPPGAPSDVPSLSEASADDDERGLDSDSEGPADPWDADAGEAARIAGPDADDEPTGPALRTADPDPAHGPGAEPEAAGMAVSPGDAVARAESADTPEDGEARARSAWHVAEAADDRAGSAPDAARRGTTDLRAPASEAPEYASSGTEPHRDTGDIPAAEDAAEPTARPRHEADGEAGAPSAATEPPAAERDAPEGSAQPEDAAGQPPSPTGQRHDDDGTRAAGDTARPAAMPETPPDIFAPSPAATAPAVNIFAPPPTGGAAAAAPAVNIFAPPIAGAPAATSPAVNIFAPPPAAATAGRAGMAGDPFAPPPAGDAGRSAPAETGSPLARPVVGHAARPSAAATEPAHGWSHEAGEPAPRPAASDPANGRERAFNIFASPMPATSPPAALRSEPGPAAARHPGSGTTAPGLAGNGTAAAEDDGQDDGAADTPASSLQDAGPADGGQPLPGSGREDAPGDTGRHDAWNDGLGRKAAPAEAPRTEERSRFSALLARLGGRRAPEPASAPRDRLAEPGIGADAGDASPADLAERAGARSVADLLAVAAAWLTLVEGKPRFTRREVMETFERLPGDHPRTLEARIKGFGKLVRSSTLILVDDGVFAMAQSERDRFQSMIDNG